MPLRLLKIITILVLAAAAMLSACGEKTKHGPFATTDNRADTEWVQSLINMGDSVYAIKSGMDMFQQSLKYYDSALTIADAIGDSVSIAYALFAKARVYDAWNKEPQKTVDYFLEATAIFKHLPRNQPDYYYAKHLVAHAYEKAGDSANAVRVLREIMEEIPINDTALMTRVDFTVELALISTAVKNYALADSILRRLTHRSEIRNNPNTYNHLDHYYLVQSRLDAYWRTAPTFLFIDSFKNVVDAATNRMDRMYLNQQLAPLEAAAGNYREAYQTLRLARDIYDSIDNKEDLQSMQAALLQSDLQAEKRRVEFERSQRQTRIRVIWILSCSLLLFLAMSLRLWRLRRKEKLQSEKLEEVNRKLDDKVEQVELLNKEIQHRVKNNLHMIYSLLEMQERKTENEETASNLQAAKLRVESVAMLHNQLLKGKENLDFGTFIKSLIAAVVRCLSDDVRVVTHLETEEIHVPENAYFALSLVLNEWVTNSIKYAANADHMVEINVRIRNTEKEVCIEYSDSGDGIVSTKTESGLGTQIVKLLTRQMGATLRFQHNHPFHYELCIPNK